MRPVIKCLKAETANPGKCDDQQRNEGNLDQLLLTDFRKAVFLQAKIIDKYAYDAQRQH